MAQVFQRFVTSWRDESVTQNQSRVAVIGKWITICEVDPRFMW